jgi:hypothetical protein
VEANSPNSRDIVDTTDSLEAVSVCRSMKNFLFFVILIGLLLPQLIFWMNQLQLVENNDCASCKMSQPAPPAETLEPKLQPAPAEEPEQAQPSAPSDGPVALAATVNVEEVEKVTGRIEQSESAGAQVNEEILLEKETDNMPAEIPSQDPQAAPQTESELDVAALFTISCRFAVRLVAICNFFVLTGTVLYSLTLLMCLKISLTGRLGGLNHIARAFFLSLFLLVLVFPWQRLLPGVLIGSMWTPGELLCGGWGKANASALWKVLFYLRFTGLWFAAVWLLFWAQLRTGKWARATLRRLGVVR